MTIRLFTIALFCFFAIQAKAFIVSPQQMTNEQKAQLLEVLDQMEPEILEALLSEEASQWYVTQSVNGDELESGLDQVTNAPIDVTGGVYYNANAPTFD